MSEAALKALDLTGHQLVTLTRSSRSFTALREGSASVQLYRDWLTQTALYCAVTGKVLATAADTLARAEDPLARWAADFATHGQEEGDENTVILEDLAGLGVRLEDTRPIPPIAVYLAMVQALALDDRWAIGIYGLVRTLELLAADCAPDLHENLGRSTFPEIRNALRFIGAHRDEAEHLARTEAVIQSVPAEYDHTLVWCGRITVEIYSGLLAHLDAESA